MEGDILPLVADLGSAGAVLAMGWIFIKYIKTRDEASAKKDDEWLKIMSNHMSEEIRAFTHLSEKIDALGDKIHK